MKLFDSEWKVMEVLWQDGDTTAKELSLRLEAEAVGRSSPSPADRPHREFPGRAWRS